MLRRSVMTLACVLVFGTTVCVGADETPDKLIPHDAIVVARVKAPLGILKKLETWIPQHAKTAKLNQVNDGIREYLQEIRAEIEGPSDTTDNVPKSEFWFALFSDEKSQEFVPAFFVEVKDRERTKTILGDAEIRSFGTWQIVTTDSRILDRCKDCQDHKSKSFADVMAPRMRQMMEQRDVAAYVDLAHLRQLLRPQLDELNAFVREALSQNGGSLLDLAGISLGQARKKTGEDAENNPQLGQALLTLADGVMDLIEDSQSLSVGLAIDEKRIAVDSFLAVAPATASARFFERNRPTEMKLLGKLPPGALIYYGLCGDLTPLEQWTTHAAIGSLKKSVDEKDALFEKIKTLDQSKTAAYVGSLRSGRTPTEFDSTFVVHTQPEQQYRADINRFIEWTGTYDNSPASVKPNAETIHNHPVDLVTVKPEQAAEPDAEEKSTKVVQTSSESIESHQTRTTTLPGAVLQTNGGGTKLMEDVLRAVESGDGIDHQSPWKSVRDQLGPQLNFVALLDIPRLAAIVGGSVPQISTANAAQEQVFKAALRKIESVIKPSYAGVAVTTEPQGARLVAVLPREQFVGAVSAMEILNGELENLVIAGSKSPDKTGSAKNPPMTAHVEADGPADEDDANHSVVVEAKLISGPKESVEEVLDIPWPTINLPNPAGKSNDKNFWTDRASHDLVLLRQADFDTEGTRDLVAKAQASAQLNLIAAPPVTIVAPVVNCPGRRLHGDEAKIVFGDQKAGRGGAASDADDEIQPVAMKIENGITLVVRPDRLKGDEVALSVQIRQCDGGQTRKVQFAAATNDQLARPATIRTINEHCLVSPGHSVLLTGPIPNGDKQATESFAILLTAHRSGQQK